jgi:elongation factor P
MRTSGRIPISRSSPKAKPDKSSATKTGHIVCYPQAAAPLLAFSTADIRFPALFAGAVCAPAPPLSNPAEPMKINANAIKPGNVLQHEGGLWTVVKTQHVKPGKGGAFAQVELKNIEDGRKLNERWRTSETVERITLEQKDHTYLYENGDMLVFMDTDNYEQIELHKDFVGEERVQFLQDGMKVTLEFHDERPIGMELPDTVVLEIVEADGVVKGQTASSSYKPAKASNGMRIMIPPFMEVGQKIVVSTDTGEYLRRAD